MGKIVNPQIVIVKGGETPTPPTTGDYFVKVIDFDGTVLKSANLNNGDTFELPTPPSHDGLVFQEWSSSQSITDNKITINNNNVMVGAVYTTASGLSEFDIELTAVTGLSVTLNMSGTKNWGDGTSDASKSHTYSAIGSYTITCDGTMDDSLSGLFGQGSSTSIYYCKRVRLGNNISSIDSNSFYNCRSLTSIIIPNSVTSYGSYILRNCYSLTSIVMPSSITQIKGIIFDNCYSLTDVVIPNSVTSFGGGIFQSNFSLNSVAIPNSVTSMGNNDFMNCYSLPKTIIFGNITTIGSGFCRSCYSLTKVVIPGGVTSIVSQAFDNCYSIIEYDFSQLISVPTLANIDAFTGINGICKMKIPSALIDEWKTATNWATYADYMVAV